MITLNPGHFFQGFSVYQFWLSAVEICSQISNISMMRIYIFQMIFDNRGTGGSNLLAQTNNLGGMLTNLVHDSVYDKTRIERMYQYPAKMSDALMHKKANEFGYNSKNINGKPAPLCPCCELPINTVRIKLKYGTTPTKEHVKAGSNIFLLNPGTTMFFTFIKMTIAYLLLRFILSDCYNLISNTSATSCNRQGTRDTCSKNAMAKFSTFNKQTAEDQPMLYAVDILNLITIVVSIVFFLYYRKYQYQVYSLTDIGEHTQSDYSVFLEDIPIFLPKTESLIRGTITAPEFDYQQELRVVLEEAIEQFIQNVKANQGTTNNLTGSFYKLLAANPNIEYQHKVTSITLCFDLNQMEKLNKMRQEMMARHNENIQNNIKDNESSIDYIPTQIDCLNQEYINLSKKFAMDNTASFNLSHFVGKAFVSFQYEHYKQYLLQYLREQKGLKLRGQTIKINSAAEPSDIYWFNMKISNVQRRNSIIYSFVIMFMTLIFSFGLIFGLQIFKSSKNNAKKFMTAPGQTENVALNYLFTIGMTTITTAINFLLADFIAKLTAWENHKTKTDYIVSLMVKTVIAQFANTAVIYYIVSVVQKLTLPPDQTSPLDQNGLVASITSLIAVSGVIQIVLNIIQPGVLIGNLINWYKYNGKETVNKFQIEFNNEMQDPQFDFSNRYAYYIVNVFIVSFYSYMTPYIGIILIIIFVAQYWVDKYNLFQRFSCPVDFNYRLSRLTLKAFECSVFVFALGNLLFSITIHTTKEETQYHILNLVSFFVALVYCIAIMFLPKKWFEKIEDDNYETKSYSDCLKDKDFKKVYWLSNPATSFAKEPDVNNRERFVDYGDMNEFADVQAFNQFMEAEKKGDYEVETYSPDAEKFVAENIIKQAGSEFVKGLIDNNGDGEFNILGKIANSSK